MSEPSNIVALLVEDDDEDAAVFRRCVGQLAGHNVAVTRAATESDALSRLAAGRIDLIFLDLNLNGGGSGNHLLNCLQHDKVNIPVIVITGSGDEIQAVEAMKAGACDYLPKNTLSVDLLERTIRNARARHALELERARMIDALEQLSVTDELTGLANRRCLLEKLDEEVRRSERSGSAFALLMIDFDRFKEINDRCGHQAGDDVLRKCADVLKQGVRATDLVARYGGEEFCVVLPYTTSRAGARCVAERLRQAMEALPDPVPTISVGIASWEPGRPASDVLHAADAALYKAKEAGRNCVVADGDEQQERPPLWYKNGDEP